MKREQVISWLTHLPVEGLPKTDLLHLVKSFVVTVLPKRIKSAVYNSSNMLYSAPDAKYQFLKFEHVQKASLCLLSWEFGLHLGGKRPGQTCRTVRLVKRKCRRVVVSGWIKIFHGIFESTLHVFLHFLSKPDQCN